MLQIDRKGLVSNAPISTFPSGSILALGECGRLTPRLTGCAGRAEGYHANYDCALRSNRLLGALPQGTSPLLHLGGMRPDDLPLAFPLFVKVRVPERDGAALAPLD